MAQVRPLHLCICLGTGVCATLQIFADGVDYSGRPELRVPERAPDGAGIDTITSKLQIWKPATEVFLLVNIMSIFLSLTLLGQDESSLFTVLPHPHPATTYLVPFLLLSGGRGERTRTASGLAGSLSIFPYLAWWIPKVSAGF